MASTSTRCWGITVPAWLVSKNGMVAVAPVSLKGDEEEGGGGGYDGDNRRQHCRMTNLTTNFNDNEETIRRLIISNLPPPLDLPILAKLENTDKKTWRILRFVDLLSGLGSLGSWADFEQESRTSWMNYDAMPASLLFERAGITIALYDELVSPPLSVLPMCPLYDCSAAAALSCFHVFALQSRGAFDVRWCRGSISERIFEPWRAQLERRGVWHSRAGNGRHR